MLRFRLRTMLVALLLIGLGLGLWQTHAELRRTKTELQTALTTLNNEHTRQRTDAGQKLAESIQRRESLLAFADDLVNHEFDPQFVARNVRTAARWYALTLCDSRNTDEALAGFSELTEDQLKMVYLSNSDVSAEGLRHLAAHPNISFVDLQDCEGITDEAFAELAALPSLRKLYLGGTQISEQGIAWFSGQRPGCVVLH